jgi:hypothetical protein
MKVAFAPFLLAWQLATGLSVVAPYYPPKAFNGGNVVAVAELSKGTVRRVVILHAEEPFVEPTRAALARWRFPGDRKEGAVLVVVNFRQPNLIPEAVENGVRFMPVSRSIQCRRYGPNTPVPTLVVDPLYFVASHTVVGAAILQLQVAASGSVGAVTVLQGFGNQTQPCVDAVKKWTFAPARDASDKPVASEVFAICVYRPLWTSSLQ